jgi:cell division protein FtsB
MYPFPRLLTVKSWAILGVIVVVLLMLLSWRGACTATDTAKDQNTIANGRTASAVETLDIVTENAALDAETQQQVKEAQDAVRQAAPADRERVARRELCQLQGRSPC